ncbi:MAG: cytochrome c oxidase subunit II [Actinomycetota bacterium]
MSVHVRRVLTALVVVVGAALLSGCASSFGIPDGATEQGREINDLWGRFFVASLIVGGITLALIVIAIVVFRRRRGDDALPRQSEGNVPLEIVYTAIPIAIVIVLWSLSMTTENRVLDVADDPDVSVHVEAFAWGWRFGYPQEGVELVSEPDTAGPQMVLPVGRTTRIRLTSDDVIHSFYVPDFLFKRDAVPGHVWEFDITPAETGVFEGTCAEFCGLNHAFMRFSVRVVEPAEYESWLRTAADAQAEQEATL